MKHKIDLDEARQIEQAMSPLPWIVLEEENGEMIIIRNSNHPMHKDGLIAWGQENAANTPDAIGIAYMCENFSNLIGEIERLRADLEQAEICILARMECIDDQAAYIKELESSLDEAEALTNKNAELMNAYLARIAELEDALVEERAKYNLSWKDCAYRAPNTYCEKTHNYCTSEDCPLLDEQKTEARRQLKEEGKIGPDAAKPQSWQITEERIGLLEYCIEMLRAMLREAEQ